MWIFCCGMMRSGSTLQFQIATHIVEEAGIGKRVGWVAPERFPEAYKRFSDYDGLKVFKVHVCTPEIAALFKQGGAKGIYSFRDIRDVVVSQMRKDNKTFDQMMEAKFIDVCLENFKKWTALPDVLVSRYEDMMSDLPCEVCRIAKHLGISLDRRDCERIASSYTLDKQVNRIKDFVSKLPDRKIPDDEDVFDPESLLHHNHINSGETGQWKKVLDTEQVRLIEGKAGAWLLANGYELSGSNEGKDMHFYSQFGEDFLLWTFFNGKKDGFFVDVGAFDGVHLSNSYFFEQQGWKGICVEPHPKYYPLLKKNRPRSVCIKAAVVGNKNIKEVDFYVETSGLYSGILGDRDDEVCSFYENTLGMEHKGLKKTSAKAIILNAVLDKHLPPGTDIDFISIDVEGTELDVLKGLDLKRFRPRVLVVETNTGEARERITEYLSDYGYTEGRQIGVNTFYVTIERDAERLNKIELAYKSAKNLHPLGEEYTLKQFREEDFRSERTEYIRQIERLKRRVQKQGKEIEILRAERDKMLNSLSWKVTAPLRRAISVFRRKK